MARGIKDKVVILGMGCSKFGENWDKDPQDMIVEAAYEAYADAHLENPQKQIEVGQDVARQLAAGEDRIFGIMLESHLKAGRQDLVPGKTLVYGQSITDGCISWEDSRKLLDTLAEGVRKRRVKLFEAEH